MLQDARNIAIQRAKAEGWTRISVTAIKKIGVNAYEVTVVLT